MSFPVLVLWQAEESSVHSSGKKGPDDLEIGDPYGQDASPTSTVKSIFTLLR